MGEAGRRLWKIRSRICFCVSALCVFLIIWRNNINVGVNLTAVCQGAAAIVFFTLGLFSLDISSKCPSDNYNLYTTLVQYIHVWKSLITGRWFLKQFLNGTTNLVCQQQKLLLSILAENENTMYGRDHKFCHIKSTEMFRTKHPLTTHQYFGEYVDAICSGKHNVLTNNDVIALVRTSGTTGKSKLVPFTLQFKEKFRQVLFTLTMATLERKGGKVTLNKQLVFAYKQSVIQVACGLIGGPGAYIVSIGSKDLTFVTPKTSFMLENIGNEQTAFYLHALVALQEEDLQSIQFIFICQLHAFWQYMQLHINAICNDIKTGTLNEQLEIDYKARKTIEKDLIPNKSRAIYVRNEFAKGVEGLAKRLWPGMVYFQCITPKTMAAHTTYLKNTIFKDVLNLPLFYGASEGLYGLDISPIELDNKFTLAYPFGFFEFIIEDDCDEEQPETLLAHQLHIGHCYELVITNEVGLYRYRTGDIIRITSYLGECPVMEVMHRRGQLLNVFWEKTPESVFCEAVINACENLDVRLEEYTATENRNLSEGECRKQYVLFLETDTGISKKKYSTFDQSLCNTFEVYKELRSSDSIDEMVVVQVAPGTFAELKQMLMKHNNNSTVQFKMPRVLRTKQHLNFLMDNKI